MDSISRGADFKSIVFMYAIVTAYQKDNVIVKDGKLTLEGRFEKVMHSLLVW